jgi:hypothetical protein
MVFEMARTDVDYYDPKVDAIPQEKMDSQIDSIFRDY